MADKKGAKKLKFVEKKWYFEKNVSISYISYNFHPRNEVTLITTYLNIQKTRTFYLVTEKRNMDFYVILKKIYFLTDLKNH